ncbi:MAG: hypothetical protein LM590_03925 [Thermofilum sp.]|nr:hypothetical protein [Thermofilum sp.]
MKTVLWALDIPAYPHVYEKLKESLREDVRIIGVGPLFKADEIISLAKEYGASEVVTLIEDPCEMHKLLSAGIKPLVAVFEEVATCRSEDECRGYESKECITEKTGDSSRVLKLREFARVIDIMFELSEPVEEHEH